MVSPVEFQTQSFAGHYKLGVIRLNHAASLNALSMEMITLMLNQLESWRMDQNLVAVWLEGAGDKAFCAGGNVVDVYRSLEASNDTCFAHRYFEDEYALDYLLKSFPKPVICWGDGYVMGGGMGLMMASRYRIVTPSSKLAMPEISIGLYPDVGASYFLNQLESKEMARFLALTGYQVSATDACELGLATHYLMAEDRDHLMAAFSQASMAELDPKKVTAIIEQILFTYSQSDELPLLKPELTTQQSTIKALMSGTIENVYAAMLSYLPECPSMQKAKQNFLHGSPLSAHIIVEQLEWAQDKSLESVFVRELQLSVACCAHGDFKEGVRALLVDKDKRPRWQYGHISDVPKSVLVRFFSDEHPVEQIPASS
ncbi:enoyl-CoA hydratase/isomerase family protein [Marinomonas pollencensis]|uniref:3-hydroxyisobutyryl-CoA hydrolase n=1 Tax=Marinomonas pollencensis TaxID=491954 RepID=A0A3E0DL12_9GAMM|nr:enoyl-CoA hydratase/isomerase family protein [Marinomonas pollencensis]REG82226.1 enoyl-CoA hydratase/isomerase-like protein [Marinomonas pollencensis]